VLRFLDDIVRPEYKVYLTSPLPGLHGWNSTMSIQEILAQLETTFGRVPATILFNNNAAFAGSFNPMDTLETLFHRIEECQEVKMLGGGNVHKHADRRNNNVSLPAVRNFSDEGIRNVGGGAGQNVAGP
jgi:hypothetical protein